MVKVKNRNGQVFEEGINLLRQMVLARAFPDIGQDKRHDLITEVFDYPETLNRLCLASGGHVRDLLVLLFSCLQQEDPPISSECLEEVIQRKRNMLERTITNDEWDLLQQVTKTRQVSGEKEYAILVSSLLVFEYEDKDGKWFDVNPLLEERLERS